MDAPILLVVDDDPEMREALSADLGRRFAADYRILAEASPSALTTLERLAAESRPVAMVVAGRQLIGTSGVELLEAAHRLHPAASAEPRTGGLQGSVACDRQGYVLTGQDLPRRAAGPVAGHAATLVPGDEPARGVRRRGCPPPVRQARRIGRRRGLHRRAAHPPVPRRSRGLTGGWSLRLSHLP